MPRPNPTISSGYGPNSFGQAYAYRKHRKTLTGTHTYAQLRDIRAAQLLKSQDKGHFHATSSHPMPAHARSRISIGNAAAKKTIHMPFSRSPLHGIGAPALLVRSGGPWKPWFNTKFGTGERSAAMTHRGQAYLKRVGPGWATGHSRFFSGTITPK